MQSIHRLDHLRNVVAQWRVAEETIALVPTMGALHEGHLTLVRAAREKADRVAVSIFVNPTQFGPNEDLDAYPRTLEADSRLLDAEGVDALWAPDAATMYPDGFSTSIAVDGVSGDFCGRSRPGHFAGVATVVCKLFNQVQPDLALFGEKDWQQLAVIRTMARDLDLARPAVDAILGVPTVREADGLAMSSRNVRLTPEDRDAAVVLARALDRGEALLRAGAAEPEPVLAAMREIIAAEPRADLASLDIRDAATLDAVTVIDERPVVILVTARFGDVLLIDQRVAEKAHGSATGGKAA